MSLHPSTHTSAASAFAVGGAWLGAGNVSGMAVAPAPRRRPHQTIHLASIAGLNPAFAGH